MAYTEYIGDTGTPANNVSSQACTRASIAAFEAAIAANDGTGVVSHITNPTDTASVTINAAFTGIVITALSGAEVNAPTNVAANARGRVNLTASNGLLTLNCSGVIYEKLSVISTSTTGTGAVIEMLNSCTFRRCVVITNGSHPGIIFDTGSYTMTLSNNAIISSSSHTSFCLRLNAATTAVDVYHTSVLTISGSTGFSRANGTLNTYACIVQGAGTCWAGTIGGDYNVSQDATAPGSASTKYARGVSGWFAVETAGSEDLSLQAGAVGWWAVNKTAIDQTGWPSDVATDLAGTTRSAPIDPGVSQGTAAATPALIDDLIVYYKLDEASGTRVDSHTNALDLTDHNTVGSTTGVLNSAASFVSASTEYLDHADDALFDVGRHFSLSYWVRSNAWAANQGHAAKWNFNTQGGWAIRTPVGDATEVAVYIAATLGDAAGNVATTTDFNPAADTWYHVVVVYDGYGDTATKVKVYVNGTLKTLSVAGTIPAATVNNTALFELGRWTGGAGALQGLLDEVGFWGRSLSAADVTALYNGGSGFAYPFSAGGATTNWRLLLLGVG